ncbi:MAG: Gfo/Idh/MocA family protein [Candidatus Zipacnadales bacterium]
MPGKPIKIGIIGCGHIARKHLESYAKIMQKESDLFRITSVCDHNEDSARQFAHLVAEWQDVEPMVHVDVHKMVVHYDLDGADICTPHYDHHITGVQCLEAGTNVLIEKPFGVTVKASRLIIEAAERKGLITACANNIRRQPAQRAAHWAIHKKGMIGEPRMFFIQHAGYHRPLGPQSWHWRTDKFMGGGGMIMDSGVHFADTISYLFGEPERVYATVRQHEKWPFLREGKTVFDDREDTWMAILNFKSGVDGFWSSTVVAPGEETTQIAYYGSAGSITDDGDVFHGPHPTARITRQGEGTRLLSDIIPEYMASLSAEERGWLFPHGFEDGMTLEIYDFLRAIATGTQPEIDGKIGLRTKAICEAIYESGHCREAVPYDDVVSGFIEGYQREINERWGL